jgi:hypothetical protein
MVNLNPSSYANMSTVVASRTAMDAIAANSKTVPFILAVTTARTAVAGSRIALSSLAVTTYGKAFFTDATVMSLLATSALATTFTSQTYPELTTYADGDINDNGRLYVISGWEFYTTSGTRYINTTPDGTQTDFSLYSSTVEPTTPNIQKLLSKAQVRSSSASYKGCGLRYIDLRK